MVRKAKPKKSRIYQHFAAATLGITVVIALVAEGPPEPDAERSEDTDSENEARDGELRVAEKAPIFQSMPTSDPGWGGEAAGGSGSGSNAWSYGAGSASGGGGNADVDDATLAQLGISRAEWDALTSSEKTDLLDTIGGARRVVAENDRRAAATEDSRARSGAEDYRAGGDAPG